MTDVPKRFKIGKTTEPKRFKIGKTPKRFKIGKTTDSQPPGTYSGVLRRSRRNELILSVVKAHLELAVFWSKLPEGGPAELDERTVKYLLGVLTEEAISTTSPMGCDDEEI